MKVLELVNDFKSKNIQNTKINPDAISEYLKTTLEIKTYIPFMTKRKIAEMVVEENITIVDGLKKNDPISHYVSFVIAVVGAHTNLEFSENPIDDYDLLAESGLLSYIIAEFKESYDEFDVVTKMALASALEDNNLSFLFARLVNGILDMGNNFFGEALGNFDINNLMGNLNSEDYDKLKSFLNTYNK